MGELRMSNGKVIGIFISPVAGGVMKEAQQVMAIAGHGLEGDRYADGGGSFNKGKIGVGQVTLINGFFSKKRRLSTPTPAAI